jgi:hypothetical protein
VCPQNSYAPFYTHFIHILYTFYTHKNTPY